ncbi:uncharacterized protein PITG_03317 [Phytophthora infestans T30-4]|uniref:Uncharacterized protein n=1 Tax=Phytophthora infestans (strain T30-4) TaxID=403677 RepID=D0MZX9_PHYIT|nr:uncharacterized protein PITG_03317 [Phytophthora infestans T30-4]EEY65792.1 conserved hypothetical protein [Phytophthora infestans T30-4]|eukprot:XP_002906391.1 conserved hypothetical protein [Phytophthora infestans T30-4]
MPTQYRDIVTEIYNWKQTSNKQSELKDPRKHQILFAESAKKKHAKPTSDDKIPSASEDIQLSRLMDDYMLGEKGDQIMQQMEDLTTNEQPSPITKPRSHFQVGDRLPIPKSQEPALDLDAMRSMEDFEKYIAEN